MSKEHKDPLLTFLEELVAIEGANHYARTGVLFPELTSLINNTVGHCSRVSDHCAKDLFDFLSHVSAKEGFRDGYRAGWEDGLQGRQDPRPVRAWRCRCDLRRTPQ